MGSANRWGTAHSVFTTGDTDWILISAGSPFDLPYEVRVTSGALTATVSAGQTATYSLQLTPGVDYNGIVSFTCTGALS